MGQVPHLEPGSTVPFCGGNASLEATALNGQLPKADTVGHPAQKGTYDSHY